MTDISNSTDDAAIQAVLNSLLTDITAAKVAIAGINAKLDADTGVADTDYAATWDMGALTTTA